MAIQVFGWRYKDRNTIEPSNTFVLRTTKPDSTNVGAGIIRAFPTAVLNYGDTVANGSWTAPDLLNISGTATSIKDKVVNGRINLTGTDQTVENCLVRGDSTRQPTSGSPTMITTTNATNATVRYNTVRPTYANPLMNGLGRRNGTYEYNDVSGVVDMVSPAIESTAQPDVKLIVRGNYLHHPIFYAPDSNHSATPIPSAAWGTSLAPSSPWYNGGAGVGWDHSDVCQCENDTVTGVNFYGNTCYARWDPPSNGLSLSPLPARADDGTPLYKELSCLMLNGGRNLIFEDNWFDGGEYCVNNSDVNVTGVIHRNRFGRGMATHTSGDSGYYALMIAASGLDTGNGTADQNIWEDTGLVVPRRAN